MSVTEGVKTCPSCGFLHPIGVRDCARCGRLLVIRSGTVLADRFTVKDLVATGGMAQIYLARQHAIDRDVALKVVPPSPSGGREAAEALLNEAFLAGRVTHPHIVSVFDHGTFEGGHLYLAMEYLRGRTLGQALAQDGPIAPVATTRLLIEVCEALAVLHDSGLVHRDLKPSNIFLVPMEGGRDFVKLLDFGLVTVARPLWFFPRGRGRTGTPLYMAPEQIRGDPVDARSDLYSLGTIAYEMLVGRPVFPGLDPFEEHLKSIPTPISIAAPAVRVPRALDDLVLRLLSKDPRSRPRHAGEVLQRLQRLLPSGFHAQGVREAAPEAAAERDVAFSASRGLRLRDPDFVGREREVQVFDKALDRARAGEGSVVWLLGERGSGKSTLGRHLLGRAANAGFRTASCPPTQHGPILGSFRPVITDLLGLKDPTHDDVRQAVARRIGVPEEDAIAEGVADVVVAGAALREHLMRDRDPFVAFLQTAIEGFLRRFAATEPFVAFLDDFHLADPDSGGLLDRLARGLRAQPAPILVLVASVPLPRSPDGALRMTHRALATVRTEGVSCAMSRLGEADVAALLDSMSPVECAPSVRRVVRRAAGGNPLFAVQMFRHLATRGAVAVIQGQVRLVPGADTSVPEVLSELIKARLDELRRSMPDGVEAEEVLTRIVLLGAWATARNVCDLLDREGRHDLRDAMDLLLDRLVAEGFVKRVPWGGDDVFVPSHPLFTDVVRERPLDSVGIRLRLLAAQTLERACADHLVPAAGEIGRLYLEAGYQDRAADYLIMAADAAFEDSRHAEAVAQYLRAEECLKEVALPGDERLGRVVLALAELRFVEGRYREAEQRLASLHDNREFGLGTTGRLRVLELQARVAEAGHETDRTLIYCSELVKAGEKVRDQHRVARALLIAASVWLDQGDNAEAARLIDRAEELVREDRDSETMGQVHLARGRLYMKVGTFEQCFDALKKALDILSGPTNFLDRAQALFFYGARLVNLERRAEAVEVFREGVALCEMTGFSRGLAAHLANLGTSLGRLGRVEEGREAVRRSLEIREKMGDRRGVAHSLTALADLALLEKDYGSVLDLSGKALAICREYVYPIGERIALANLGQACLGLGDLEGAEQHLRECLATTEKDRSVEPSIPAAHEHLAEVLERKGDAKEALRHRIEAMNLYDRIERDGDAGRIRASLGLAGGEGV